MKKVKFNRFAPFFAGCLMVGLFTQCQPEEDIVPAIEETTVETIGTPIDSTDLDTLAALEPAADTYGEVTYIVGDSMIVDGAELGIQPGDVIGLQGGKTYGRIIFRNIVGTKDQPVIIRNFDGVAEVYSDTGYGLKFENSENFILSGNGSGDQYGIRVTTREGFFITMEMFTTDFEITRVEVAGHTAKGLGSNAGFAGIGIKTSPYQDFDTFSDPTRQAWIMQNVSIHDNYIHDTGGEGLYIGHGFYAGRKEKDAPVKTYSHSIKGLRVYNNLIEDVGYDGIQIKNADEDVEVYNNVVRNYGTKQKPAHNEGLFIGEGSTGKYYNNIIDTGSGNGCMIQGLGNIDLYNNVFMNQGGHGIYATGGEQAIRLENAPFNIMNNTVYNSGDFGFVFYGDDGGTKRFMNNLVVKAGTLTKESAPVEMENNIFTNNVDSIGFENLGLKDLRLDDGSVAIDAGTDLRSFGIEEGCAGQARPSGEGFDIGAYEH